MPSVKQVIVFCTDITFTNSKINVCLVLILLLPTVKQVIVFALILLLLRVKQVFVLY